MLFVFCLFFFSFCLSVPIDVLLVAYDTGDSNIIRQLAEKMEKESQSYSIVGFGRAKTIFKLHPKFQEIADGSVSDRSVLLSQKTICQLKKSFHPKVVFSGMASTGQAQILNAFPNARTYAVYDNFDSPQKKDFIQPFIKEVGPITGYMIPAGFLLKEFKNFLPAGSAIFVVGQPALEDWASVFNNCDRVALRQSLKIRKTEKVILFAGGMDDTYAKYFDIFIQAVKQRPSWRVFVTYHPKSTGEVERRIVEKYKASNVFVSNDVKTNHLAIIADILVCHKSSVCQQAFSVGVRCGYVVGDDYSNFLIDQGLVPKFNNSIDLLRFLDQEDAMPQRDRLTKQRIALDKSGVPTSATQNIVHILRN